MAKRDGRDRRAARKHLSAGSDAGSADDTDIRNRYNEEVAWEVLLLERSTTGSWPSARRTRLQPTRLKSSRIHNLKELRPRVSGTSRIRLLFVFDPAREAIVLVAGDKAGRWSAWYAEAIPLAEERYAIYRREADEEEE